MIVQSIDSGPLDTCRCKGRQNEGHMRHKPLAIHRITRQGILRSLRVVLCQRLIVRAPRHPPHFQTYQVNLRVLAEMMI